MSFIETPGERNITIGNFDGVHIGHRRLIALLGDDARRTVFTFTHHTREGTPDFARLYPPEINDMILRSPAVGAEEIIRADFASLCAMEPETFVNEVLFPLSLRSVVCGNDFRFGKGAVGDTKLLGALLGARGVRLVTVGCVSLGCEPVSTTAIKKELSLGNPANAAKMLGCCYFIHSKVNAGNRLGRRLNAATVNQSLYSGCQEPRYGVYASVCTTDSGTYRSVTNVGVRPTVGAGVPNAETHILGYAGDELYGKEITVSLTDYIRPEKRFASLEELARQIEKDKQTVLQLPVHKKDTIIF
ncbi:MAG TPA: riboflavin kinase [Bacillota bacterium]|nr:riboflavin kinase [Bacillota bacterium]